MAYENLQVMTELDPNKEYTIDELTNYIRNAMTGKNVREALARSMEATNEIATWARDVAQGLIDGAFDAGELATMIESKLNQLEQDYAPKLTSLETEIEDARGNESNLGDRLNDFSSQLAQITTDPSFEASEETETAALGNELATSTGWTVPNGWTGNFTNGFKNTVGNTNPLVFNMPEPTGAKSYQVAFRVESPTPAGVPNASTDFEVTLGNSAPFVTYQGGGNFDYTFGIQSVSDGDLKFIPGSTFDGTIKNISVKEIIGEVKPSIQLEDSEGSKVFEARTTTSGLQNVFIGKNSGKKNTTGRQNVSLGDEALSKNTTGYWNQAIGREALRDNTVGSRNIALGYLALERNISGDRNIAIGTFTLERNTTGRQNIGLGADTLWFNESGNANIALGMAAMADNISGSHNIALGMIALEKNVDGDDNIAIGRESLLRNISGNANIAIGRNTMKNNTATSNTAVGNGAMVMNTTGGGNVAIGASALYNNQTGYDNTVIGQNAGQGTLGNYHSNTLIGRHSGYKLTTGANYNTFIGKNAGREVTTGANNILIGRDVDTPTPTTSNFMNIGNVLYGNIPTKTIGVGVEVPTAALHLKAGTTTLAPLKFTVGVLTDTPNVGALEFDGTNLYLTNQNGQRKQLAFVS